MEVFIVNSVDLGVHVHAAQILYTTIHTQL